MLPARLGIDVDAVAVLEVAAVYAQLDVGNQVAGLVEQIGQQVGESAVAILRVFNVGIEDVLAGFVGGEA